VQAFHAATAASDPEGRADVVARVASLARASKCEAAGVFSVSVEELGVGNSLGVRAYQPLTQAQFTAIITDTDASGYAQATSRDIARLDPPGIAQIALRKCLDSRRPSSLAPGEYEVILEPAAVTELILMLGYLGFGATSVQEDRSFLTGRFGTQVMSPRISIWDDALDPRGLPVAFDFEGMPKQRVDIIERGMAHAVVYDSYTAHKEKKLSTGHAWAAPNTWGPVPSNLFMATGTSNVAEMIENTGRGVLVTRFHYVNPIHEKRTEFTGMTRDGTFLVEEGKLRRPVRNLRFTQGIAQAFSEVQLVGSEAEQVDWCMAPAVKLARFRFSG
jgi:predicted Zn-dependent protease